MAGIKALGEKKARTGYVRAFWLMSLAIPYFHMANCHTIIGAKRFHFRVRDGGRVVHARYGHQAIRCATTLP